MSDGQERFPGMSSVEIIEHLQLVLDAERVARAAAEKERDILAAKVARLEDERQLGRMTHRCGNTACSVPCFAAGYHGVCPSCGQAGEALAAVASKEPAA